MNDQIQYTNKNKNKNCKTAATTIINGNNRSVAHRSFRCSIYVYTYRYVRT